MNNQSPEQIHTFVISQKGHFSEFLKDNIQKTTLFVRTSTFTDLPSAHAATKNGAAPDLIIVVIPLDETHAEPTIRQAIRHFALTPIIVAATGSEAHLGFEAISAGAADWLDLDSLDPQHLEHRLKAAMSHIPHQNANVLRDAGPLVDYAYRTPQVSEPKTPKPRFAVSRKSGQPRLNPAFSGFMQIRPRILLIEDDDLVRELFKHQLESLGLEVVSQNSATEASRLIFDLGQHFDVMLTDQRLPGTSGIDLARNMHTLRPRCQCILMSCVPLQDLAPALKLNPWLKFIPKPADLATVQSVVVDSIEERQHALGLIPV